MDKTILEVILDEMNRDYYIKHHNQIQASLVRQKLEQPALTDDEFWSKTESIN